MGSAPMAEEIKMNSITVLTALFLACAFSGCSRTKSDYMRLSKSELKALEAKALAGDSSAAMRIASHFDYGTQELEKSIYWLTLAANQGDKRGCQNLKVKGVDPLPERCAEITEK
jgi:TPR repeat protein